MAVEQAKTGSSTAAQRRAIVLAGRARGLDVDALRALTPAGSIRALSFAEASALLDSLNRGATKRRSDEKAEGASGNENETGPGGPPCETREPDAGSRRKRCPGGREGSRPRRRAYTRAAAGVLRMRTAEQLRHIESLRESLGWTPAGVDDLCRRIAGAPLANVASARDASRVIVAMQNIVRWRQGKAQERRPGGYDPFERLAQRAEAEMPDIMDKLVEASRVEYAL